MFECIFFSVLKGLFFGITGGFLGAVLARLLHNKAMSSCEQAENAANEVEENLRRIQSDVDRLRTLIAWGVSFVLLAAACICFALEQHF